MKIKDDFAQSRHAENNNGNDQTALNIFPPNQDKVMDIRIFSLAVTSFSGKLSESVSLFKKHCKAGKILAVSTPYLVLSFTLMSPWGIISSPDCHSVQC